MALEHGVARCTFGHFVRARLEDHHDVTAHAPLVGAERLRQFGVVLRDVPSKVVSDNAHKWFKVALFTLLITGFFMLAGVATKCYHNFYFWVKMTALFTGILFVFAIKQPLLKNDHATLSPVTLKLVALASTSLWFIVAASGRWIGFS